MTRKALGRVVGAVFCFVILFTISSRPVNAFDLFGFLKPGRQEAYQAVGSFNVQALMGVYKKFTETRASLTDFDRYISEDPKINKLTLSVVENGQITGEGEVYDMVHHWMFVYDDGYISSNAERKTKALFNFDGQAKGNSLSGKGEVVFKARMLSDAPLSAGTFKRVYSWSAKKEGNAITGTIVVEGEKIPFIVTISEVTEVETTSTLEVSPEPIIPEEEEPTLPSEPAKEKIKSLSRDQLTARFRSGVSGVYNHQVILTGGETMTLEQEADFIKDVLGIDPRDFDKDMGKGKKAYIIYSESIDSYRKTWLDSITRQSIAARRLLESLGYQVEVVSPKNSDESFDYMVDPEATAIFNFAHQHYCSIEEVTSEDLPDQIKQATFRYYQKVFDKRTAKEKTEVADTSSLNKDLFVNFSCHSLDDTNIINNTVRPGGVYYGHKGTLFPTERLDERMRP